MNNEDTNKLIQVGNLDKPEWIEARRRVYSPEGICPRRSCPYFEYNAGWSTATKGHNF